MNVLEKILEEINLATLQEDAPLYVGDMAADGYVRESVVEEIIRSHMDDAKDLNVPTQNDWIPVDERTPENNEYILLSFSNFSLPMVGRFEDGAFYLGDEEDTCVSQDLYVNAWRYLPKSYRPAEE